LAKKIVPYSPFLRREGEKSKTNFLGGGKPTLPEGVAGEYAARKVLIRSYDPEGSLLLNRFSF